MGMNTKAVGICAGLAAASALAYCVYFDHKRRSDPDFKKRLKAKRNKGQAKGSPSAQTESASAADGGRMPDFSDQEAVQRFFLQEVQLGETLLAQGSLEEGVEHLALAVAVCGQPHALLGVLQETLPPPIYALLLQNLDGAQRKVRSHAAASTLAPTATDKTEDKNGPVSQDTKKPIDTLEELE